MSRTDMKGAIMAAGRATVQSRGFSGLSFRELAKEVGIKSASIHYHFPTKGDLGAALARRYTDDGAAYLENISSVTGDPVRMIEAYATIFRKALENGNRMCLVGIMAAEYDDLPQSVREEVKRFNAVNVAWLKTVLAKASPNLDEAALEGRARAAYAAIEGAQLVARGAGDVTAFDGMIEAYRTAGLLP